MAYLVTLTFDLKDAESQDYECIQTALAKISLQSKLKGKNGRFTDLSKNTFSGVVDGKTSLDLRETYTSNISKIFKDCKVKGRFYVSVGDNYSWETYSV
tara:strand:+ start:186 stop:482 length:297 start_codon:yes stop_codon:yes gene_type:complete